MSSLTWWLERLERLHPAGIELGLERVSSVYERLGTTFPHSKVITVAGTNGKGSVVELLQNLLLRNGYTTGVYISPHLLRYNERVRVNGIELSDEQIISGFEAVDVARADVPLTYFEFGTLAALHCFAQVQPDFLILEVGLGGRLDAVNIIDPDLAIVTSVAIDHEDWLGSGRESIGREKAGIFRPGIPAICGDPEPPQSLLEYAAQLNCPLYRYGQDFAIEVEGNTLRWQGLLASGQGRVLELDLETYLLPVNIATAIQAISVFGLELGDWSALSSTVPGRLERVQFRGAELLLDIAHNPAATVALVDYLANSGHKETDSALFAVMADKDVCTMVQNIRQQIGHWYLGNLPDNPRAMKAEKLGELLQSEGIEALSICETVEQALEQALQDLRPHQRLVVFGSVFTVAAVKSIMARELAYQDSREGDV